MKTCPNCRYVWPDDYNGQCVECGKALGGVQSSNGGDLGFAFASQIAKLREEENFEQQIKASGTRAARPGDARDSFRTHPAIMEKAREMIVQREEVKYEND